MRKRILLIIILFAGIVPAFAQMLPDSTVQVVAYWELGDKQHYRMDKVKYKVEQGDTTVVEKSAEILEFEVIAADEETGYRVKMTTMESQHSDPTEEAFEEKWLERFGADVQYFETGPNGDFLRVLPIEGLEEQLEALTDAILDELAGKNPDMDRSQFVPLIRSMLTPEAVMETVEGEIAPLFMYHGSRFDLGTEYEIEDEIPSIIGDGTLKMNGRFWVDPELTDDYSVIIHMTKEADKEQVKPLVKSIVGSILQSLAAGMEGNDEALSAVEDAFKDASIKVVDYLYEEVHLGSGWPIDWGFSREFMLEIDGRQQGQIEERSFQIIVEE